MAVASQMLVRGLDGRTSCLHFFSSSIPGSLLLHRLSSLFHIPPPFLRVVTGTREISPLISLHSDPHGFFPSCTLLLRLPGGKGGFGSLLRGAATKAGQKKTSNFDACRDMSGRRLRHVNAEKKLKEWKAQAKDRELERTANEFLKKQIKRKEDESGCSKEIERYREETSRAMEDVESAVARGLVEAKRFGKRKKIDDTPTSSKKRAILWVADEDIGIEDTIIDKGPHMEEAHVHVESIDIPKIEEADHKVREHHIESVHGFEDLEKDNNRSDCGDIGSHVEESHLPVECIDVFNIAEVDHVQEPHIQSDLCSMENSGLTESAHGLEGFENDNKKSDGDDISGGIKSDQNGDSAEGWNERATIITVPSLCPTGQLNFDDFQTAVDMEVLGLERLKCELQTRGLKCGGNLAERAARLFLLKSIPLENMDKKHFAKVKGDNK